MQLASKRALDYYVGRPALVVLLVAARVIALVRRRNHDTDPVRTILIAKFQGLGSLVVAKPALAELRRRRPDARIVLWTSPSIRTLAAQMPEIDEVLILEDHSMWSAVRSAVATLATLWRRRIDWAIDFEVYSRLSSVLVTLSCARNRAGFAIEQLRSRRVHTHLVYFNRHRYLGEAYTRIVGLLLPADVVIDSTNYGQWRFDLAPLSDVPPKYMVFNIHAGDLALERRWPRESFEGLIAALLERQPDTTAVLIGHGTSEADYAAGIAKHARMLDLTNRLSLADTFRLLANASLVVTNDSAPMHFALSTGVKVVGLFGPTRAATYMLAGRQSAAAAYTRLYCSPCVHYWEPLPCKGDNQCMKRLSVKEVFTICAGLLGLTSAVQPLPGTNPDVQSTYYPGLVYRRAGTPLA